MRGDGEGGGCRYLWGLEGGGWGRRGGGRGRPPPLSPLQVLLSVLPHLPQRGPGVVLCCELVIVKMTVMFQRSPAQTNGSLAKGERKRSMPPPVSTSPPLKKAKTSSVVKEEQKEKEKEKKEESLPQAVPARESGGLVSQGCQTLPPSSRIGSNCKHGDEEDEVCPIGTPVNLPATVWYEDRDGEFLLCSHKARGPPLTPGPS